MSTQPTQRLPTECIVLVAEFLAGSFQYRTLANLSQTSRKIREETESVLFATLLWDTEEKSWILHGGRIPRGWQHVRFLVIQESSLQELSRYISSITGVTAVDNLLSIFPALVMVIAKHSFQPVKHKDESVTVHMSVTLYKSVTSSALLTAPVTGTKLRQTTFFNASVQGWTDHTADYPTWDEQLASLILRKGTFLKRVDGPAVVMKHDWQGAHSADPDFQLSLHVESAPRSPVLGKSDRYQTDVTELTDTLQEFFRLIPRRQSGETDLYHFRIDCHQDVLGLLMKLLPSMLPDSIKLVIHVVKEKLNDDEKYAVHDLRHHLRSFAKIYRSMWKQFSPIEPGSMFFRIEFVDDAEECDGDLRNHDDGWSDDQPPQNLVIGTLSTLAAVANGHGAEGKGFELVIQKMDYEDDSDWEEDEAQGRVLLEKRII